MHGGEVLMMKKKKRKKKRKKESKTNMYLVCIGIYKNNIKREKNTSFIYGNRACQRSWEGREGVRRL